MKWSDNTSYSKFLIDIRAQGAVDPINWMIIAKSEIDKYSNVSSVTSISGNNQYGYPTLTQNAIAV